MGTFQLFERTKRNYSIDYHFNDHLLPLLSGNATKILLTIIRHTADDGVEWADLSYSDLLRLTGIKSEQTITKALKELLDLDVILKTDPAMNWSKNQYAINRKFDVETPTSKNEVEPTSKNEVPDNIYNNNISSNKGSNIIIAVNNNKEKKEKESKKRKRKKVWTEEDIWNLLPDKLNTPEFILAWEGWMDWRKDPKPEGINKPLTKHPTAADRQLKKCARYPVPVAVKMVEEAIGRWESIFVLPDWDPVVLANQTTQNKPLADAGNKQMETLKSA